MSEADDRHEEPHEQEKQQQQSSSLSYHNEDSEFDTYAARGEAFNAEDQVAALLTENQNMPELQSRVADCRATYLSQLQMLLMGYHEDFLAVGRKMRDVCDVVDDLKEATRQGRAAIGDVSAWTLPSMSECGVLGAGDEQDAAAAVNADLLSTDGFALGDPWATGMGGGGGSRATTASSSLSSFSTASASARRNTTAYASDFFAGSSHGDAAGSATTDLILPVTFLARITRSNEHRRATLDAQGQCGAAISAVRQTERLLDTASERVQRRVHNHRQVLALKEIEHLAEGAAHKIGADVTGGAPLALLRTGALDSFQSESWAEHALALNDLGPRWRLLAEAGRLAAASALILRSHEALIDDFTSSFAKSAVDVRSATLRLSSTISAVIQHAARMRAEHLGEFDLGALQWWAHGQVQRAAAQVFANNVERRKHTAPTPEASAGAAAFRASAVASAADAVAMDVTIALAFLPCEEATCSPVAHALLRGIQPAQLQLVWEQVQQAASADFNFAAMDLALDAGSSSTSTREDSFIGQMGGAGELPRLSALRCLSPRLSGVVQHRGLAALFTSDEWQEACEKLAGGGGSGGGFATPAAGNSRNGGGNNLAALRAAGSQQQHHADASSMGSAQLNSELLLASHVSEASSRLWDHLASLLSFRTLVRNSVLDAQYEQQKSLSSASSSRAGSGGNGGALLLQEATDLIDFYFTASPDWYAQLDLAATHLLSSFIASLLEYRATIGGEVQRTALRAMERTLDVEEKRREMVRDGHGDGLDDDAADDGPPVLRSFRAEQLLSAVDCAIASALAVVVPATQLAGMLLPVSFPRFTTTTTSHCAGSGAQALTVACGFAAEAEIRVFRFVLDAVYYRSATTLRPYFAPNDLRLRADGGGCIDLDASPAERAALFVLAPYVNASRGGDVLAWSDALQAKAQDLETTLVALLAHKVAALIQHCSKAGGPAVAALFAAGLALFLCDESAFLSAECWEIVRQRSPTLRKAIGSPATDAAAAAVTPFVHSSIVKAVLAALHVLEPALAPAPADASSGGGGASESILSLLLPRLSAAGLVDHDSLVAHLRRIFSSSTSDDQETADAAKAFARHRASVVPPSRKPSVVNVAGGKAGKQQQQQQQVKCIFPNPPRSAFDLLAKQVGTEATRDFVYENTTLGIPRCCLPSLTDLRNVVSDCVQLNVLPSITLMSVAASTPASAVSSRRH